jgi:hypothetical protein
VAVIIEGCSSEPSDKVGISITGVEWDANNIHVYPNPFSDEFTIELASEEHISIKIMDVSGKTTHQTEGVGNIQMNTGDLVPW